MTAPQRDEVKRAAAGAKGLNAATKVGGFAAIAVAVFAGAFGIGREWGPAAPKPAPAAHGHQPPASTGPSAGSSNAHGHAEPDKSGEAVHGGHQPGADAPKGLLVTDQGYTLRTVDYEQGLYRFRITGADGQPVTAFDTVHDKQLHLIAVRRDLSGYQHVHPELAPDGTWRVPLILADAGSWRIFADFTPTGGPALTLGTDVQVAGDFAPVPLPHPADTATVDGYTVRLTGDLTKGSVTLAVTKGGRQVETEPYLGAAGHLVAIRQSDLAYLHVHPSGGLTFAVEGQAPGAYRLFLDFKHDGVVRTAAFTAEVGGVGHEHK